MAIALTWQAGSHARAQSEAEALQLQWTAPGGCMSVGSARDEIAQLVRDQGGGPSARARVQIKGSEQAGYVAEIEVERGASSGERTLRGTRCDEVAEAAVLIIAMAIDPEGASARAAERAESKAKAALAASTAGASTSTSTTTSSTTTARASTDPSQANDGSAKEDATKKEEEAEPEEEPDEPSDPRKTARLVLGLRGTGDAGSLPSATLGGGLIAGLHWQRLRLELQALAYLPQVEQSGPTQDSNTKISLFAGAIAGCYDLLGSRDEARALGACAALEAGLSHGQSRAISDGRATEGLWLASFAGLDVRQHLLGPLHLRLLAEAGLPILRPSYEIEPFGRVFRASPVLGRLGISAFVLFP